MRGLRNCRVSLVDAFTHKILQLVGYSTLIQVHIAENGITSIETGTFDLLSNLKTLRIFGNNIAELPSGAFRGLTQLNIL